jgi:hypothetical protein
MWWRLPPPDARLERVYAHAHDLARLGLGQAAEMAEGNSLALFVRQSVQGRKQCFRKLALAGRLCGVWFVTSDVCIVHVFHSLPSSALAIVIACAEGDDLGQPWPGILGDFGALGDRDREGLLDEIVRILRRSRQRARQAPNAACVCLE